MASLVAKHRFQGTQASLVVALGVSFFKTCGISQTRDRTHVTCIDRQILILWTTREALLFLSFDGSILPFGNKTSKSMEIIPRHQEAKFLLENH